MRDKLNDKKGNPITPKGGKIKVTESKPSGGSVKEVKTAIDKSNPDQRKNPDR